MTTFLDIFKQNIQKECDGNPELLNFASKQRRAPPNCSSWKQDNASKRRFDNSVYKSISVNHYCLIDILLVELHRLEIYIIAAQPHTCLCSNLFHL